MNKHHFLRTLLLAFFACLSTTGAWADAVAPTNGGTYHLKNVRAGKYLCMTESGFSFQQTASVYDSKTIWRVTLSGTTITFQNVATDKYIGAPASNNNDQAVNVGSTATNYTLETGTYNSQSCYQFKYSTGAYSLNTGGSNFVIYTAGDGGAWFQFEEATYEAPQVVQFKNASDNYTSNYLWQNGSNLYHRSEVGSDDASKWIMYKLSANTCYLINYATGNFIHAPTSGDVLCGGTATVFTIERNGTNYLFKVGSQYLHRRNNTNGHDYNPVMAYGSASDSGSQWVMQTGAKSITEAEVLTKINQNSGYATPSAGSYFRLYNPSRGKHAWEDFSSLSLKGGQNDNSYKYVWRLVDGGGGKYKIQNALTQHWVKQANTTWGAEGSIVAVANEAEATAFSIEKDAAYWGVYHWLMVANGVQMHMDGGGPVVNWNAAGANETASHWLFEHVAIDNVVLEAAQQAFRDGQSMSDNVASYQEHLDALFADKACTELNAGITAANLAQNAHYTALPQAIKNMVMKVAGNSWAAYEQTFRIADYHVYSDHIQMGNVLNMGYKFCRTNNPTGITAESDETLLVMVGSAPPAGTTLKLEMVGTVRNVLSATGNQVDLHEGLNVVNVPSRSQLYVFYEINGAENTPAYYLSNFPDITVHIEGGYVNGYFDATRGMTNADWQGMIAANLLQDERIQLKGRHVMYNWTSQEVKDNNPTDILKLLNYWDDICRLENEILGLYETDATECEKYFPGQHITERFNNVFLCIGGPSGGNPHASDYGAYFTGDQSNLSNADHMFQNGGTTWCAGHELGHNHQKTFNMCCTSEVSNNFFSNMINYEMTRACSRYEAMSALPSEYAKKHNWLEYATAGDNDTNGGRYDSQHRLHIGWALHAQMYWKLYEYYHITGRDTRFYQKVSEILRRDGNKLKRATNVAVPASEDYLRFAEACSEASGENLSEFFEMYGFFRLFSESDWYNDGAHLKEKDGHQCIHIDDYGDFYVYVTPEMIAATKARMAQYGEPVHGIIFVDDRFEGRVAKDGVTPRVAEGDTALGTQGDVACNVENYISGAAASAYTYNATMNADGTATVTMTGSGAPGYVLYDANGNIAYFASTSTFTVPANVVTELKNGGTQMQATVRTATTTGSDAKAMQSGTTVSEPGAFRVVRLKNKGITPNHYLTEKEGKLYHNKELSETGVYGDWVFFTKNGNTYLVNVQTGHMVQTPANNTHVSVTAAECAITKGESGDYIYIRGSNQQYLNAKTGGTVIGWPPTNGNPDDNSLWTIEETGSAMSEDEVMQLIAGDYLLSAKQGVFFRMKNETRNNTYAGESVEGSNHVMKGAALNTTDYAQMWYLEKAGENTYYLVNALTQRKATEPAGSDKKWTMTDTGTPLVFATNTVESTLIPHINLWKATGTSSANALHQANTSFVWSYGIGTSAKSASEWRLETVDVNMSELAARREAYRLGGEMLTNTADIQTKLRALFADEACTTLRSGVDLSENNDDYAGLPTMMRDMVDKINNNTWTDYEQTFRVADYKAYSNNREMSGVMGYGWAMAQLTNPTGIVARQNSVVAVMVGDEYDRIPVDGNGTSRASLKLEYVPSLRSQRAASGTQVELHKGLNVIEIPQESMLFVYYMLNSAENIDANYLSNYPDIKIHIEGGEVNGYFDTTRGHTDDDWRGMLNAGLLGYERIQLKTQHILINFPSAEFTANNPNDIMPVLSVWSDIAKMEDELVGYYYGNATETDKYFPSQNLTQRCNNIWNVTGGGSDGQMYAANYGAFFGGGYDNRTNRNNLKSGAALWSLGHELGHNHQKEINMLSMTEASNNMFSNATVYNFSTNTSRGYGLASVTEPYAAHRHWLEYNNTYDDAHVLSSNKWIHVILYHKLFMYFHEAGRDTRFYQKLFCELRQNPMNHRKSVTEPVPASEDYLRFAEACCAASGMNLTPLFEAYGFFRLFSESDLYNGGAHTYTVDGNECIKFKDDQYGTCGLYVTQAMIDATKVRMAAYGDPVTDIIFIDDRHADAVNAAGEACTYYGLSFTHGSEGDVGSVTAFRNPVENGTASTATFTTNADGTVTVTVTPGTSAAGYVVRDANGNMLYFTAFNTFTVPASVVTAAGGTDALQSRLKVTTTSNKELALGDDDTDDTPSNGIAGFTDVNGNLIQSDRYYAVNADRTSSGYESQMWAELSSNNYYNRRANTTPTVQSLAYAWQFQPTINSQNEACVLVYNLGVNRYMQQLNNNSANAGGNLRPQANEQNATKYIVESCSVENMYGLKSTELGSDLQSRYISNFGGNSNDNFGQYDVGPANDGGSRLHFTPYNIVRFTLTNRTGEAVENFTINVNGTDYTDKAVAVTAYSNITSINSTLFDERYATFSINGGTAYNTVAELRTALASVTAHEITIAIADATPQELRDRLATAIRVRDLYRQVNADGYVGNYNASAYIDNLETAITASNYDALATLLASIGAANTFSNDKLYVIKNQGTTTGTDGGYLEGYEGYPRTTTRTGHTFASNQSQYQWMVYNDGTSNILYSVSVKGALSSKNTGTGNSAKANWELQTEPVKHANIHISVTPNTEKPYIFCISDPQQVDNTNHRHFLHENSAGDAYTYGLTNWAAYTTSNNFGSGWTIQAVGDASNEVKAELQACIDCKLPKTGAFVMLQAKTNSKYATVANTSGGRLQLTTTDTPGANEIFYFDGSTLVSYGQGVYLRDGYSYGGVNVTTNNQYRFSTEESTDGSNHSIICTNSGGGGYIMYAAQNDTQVNRNSTPNGNNTLWTVTTLTELPVKLSSINGSGWATLYTPVTLTVPDDVEAYTGTELEEKVALTRTRIIPAGESVLLYMPSLAAATTKNFAIGVAEGVEVPELDENNCLTGTTYTHTKTEGDMTLGKGTNNVVAFRTYTGTYLSGFKAYIPAHVAQNIRMFTLSFNEKPTDIQTAIEADHDKEVYDLNGRRIERTTNGIYIINGKKVMIKR